MINIIIIKAKVYHIFHQNCIQQKKSVTTFALIACNILQGCQNPDINEGHYCQPLDLALYGRRNHSAAALTETFYLSNIASFDPIMVE